MEVIIAETARSPLMVCESFLGGGNMMKHVMKRTDLMSKEDIWNAVFSILSEYDFPTDNSAVNDLLIISQYYSELESGGHESLLNWTSEYIEEVGISSYLNDLIRCLETIGAHDYSKIEKEYGEEIWRLFKASEEDEHVTDEFYQVIEAVDLAYHKLNGKLENLVETYFMNTYTELIEVNEDE